MPEYKHEPIYQEVAITEYKHKVLSRLVLSAQPLTDA